MKLLNVPYKSQWDADANVSKDDCGAASAAMILNYYNINITTNGFFDLTGSAPDYLNFDEIKKAVTELGLVLYGSTGQSIEVLKEVVDKGIPAMVVLHYGNLPNRQDTFQGPHIMVVTGYDGQYVFTNDPDFWGSRRNEGKNKAYPISDFVKAWHSTVDGNQPGNLWTIQPPKTWEPANTCDEKIAVLENEVDGLRDSRNEWRDKHKAQLGQIEEQGKLIVKLKSDKETLEMMVVKDKTPLNFVTSNGVYAYTPGELLTGFIRSLTRR